MKPIKLYLLLLIALIAFAGNSLLNRAALSGDTAAIDWASFTAIRILSGAFFLCCFMAYKNRSMIIALPSGASFASAAALFTYAAAFSFAYISLGAGIGALILFTSVQFTLQAIGISRGIIPTWRQIFGLILAFAGLLIFLLPNVNFENLSGGPSIIGYVMMMIAGIAWGLYSWIGRSATDPSLATARNFIGAAPLCLLLLFFINDVSIYGMMLAAASGIITSAIGYIIWYAVLPQITVSTAATAQLSVPAIASIGGIAFLGEAITAEFLWGSALIFAGIGMTIWGKR